jgi:hypothetical protein
LKDASGWQKSLFEVPQGLKPGRILMLERWPEGQLYPLHDGLDAGPSTSSGQALKASTTRSKDFISQPFETDSS